MDPASNPGAMSEEKLGLSASLQEIAAVGTEKNSGEGSSAASMKCTAAGDCVDILEVDSNLAPLFTSGKKAPATDSAYFDTSLLREVDYFFF